VLLAFLNAGGSALVVVLFGLLIAHFRQEGFKIAWFGVLGFGAAQIPGVIYFGIRNRKRRAKLQGLIITSSIYLLLNAGCWGIFLRSFR
jgi:hypothetical protein